jgi:two-component sensor histidine kinase
VIWTASWLEAGEHVAFVVDQTQQKRQEEHIRQLMGELRHRVKNILTVVQAVARQTRANSLPDFLERFGDRIRSMAALQDQLFQNNGSGARLDDLIREQLAPFKDALDSRIYLDGPPLTVTGAAAQLIALAIHELATNAGKYGALANAVGEVRIAWKRTSKDRIVLSWIETGGPEVVAPTQKGFGSIVTENLIRSGLGCKVFVNYDPGGLHWKIDCTAASILVLPEEEF